MFGWAGFIFLVALMFEIEKRKLKNKLTALKREEQRYLRDCFSVTWDWAQNRRKIIGARGVYPIIINIAYLLVGLVIFWVFSDLGYAMFVALLGTPILMDNSFEMFRYSRDVRKQSLQKLQEKDKEFMEEAIRVLGARPKIYVIIGFIFLIAAQFIRQIFNLLPFVVAEYARLPLLMAERVGLVIGIFVVILSIALPTALVVKHEWTILQLERVTSWISSKIRGGEG